MIKDICLSELKQFCETYFVEALKDSGLRSFSFSGVELSKALYRDGELVSLVVYRDIGDCLLEIDFIATRACFQRSGAADELLKAFEGVEIWLELSAENLKALKFYQKQGFAITGERKNYYSNGSSALNMVRK